MILYMAKARETQTVFIARFIDNDMIQSSEQQCFSGLNVATYWLALPFTCISLVKNVSVIISNLVTKMVTQKKGS